MLVNLLINSAKRFVLCAALDRHGDCRDGLKPA